MKEFAKKHIFGLLVTSGVLILTVISLSVFLFFSFRANERSRESELILNRAEYENTLENLRQSLGTGDDRLAYHYAAEAAENAAGLGETDAAVLFRRIADTLLESSDSVHAMKDTVDRYITSGEIPDLAVPDEEGNEEEEIQSVSVYRVEAADLCVNRLFGNHNTLRRELKSRNGELIYSCSNAYAVIDYRTGLPIEAAISLDPAEKRLDADECADFAIRFLGEYFPAEIAETASVTGVTADEYSGTYEVGITARNRSMTLSVRRDNGRVARLTTR